jgi:hypothetical protein
MYASLAASGSNARRSRMLPSALGEHARDAGVSGIQHGDRRAGIGDAAANLTDLRMSILKTFKPPGKLTYDAEKSGRGMRLGLAK